MTMKVERKCYYFALWAILALEFLIFLDVSLYGLFKSGDVGVRAGDASSSTSDAPTHDAKQAAARCSRTHQRTSGVTLDYV